MKVQGIEGKRHVSWRTINGERVKNCFNNGSINDIDIAVNKWLGENQDVAIVDIKIISRDNHYDALILYNKRCTKDEFLKEKEKKPKITIENSVSVDRKYINEKMIPEVVAVLKDLSIKNMVDYFGPDLDGLAEFIKGKI